MIELFSKLQFENALPKGYWTYSGLIEGEHTYKIQITPDIFITIRSSVGSNDWSAETGEDSIRAWLITHNNRVLSVKTQKWVTRSKGWDKRLLDMLRKLWELARVSGYCKTCNIPRSIFKAKKNKKLFCQCTKCNNSFEWIGE
jgi:hypothetical protein